MRLVFNILVLSLTLCAAQSAGSYTLQSCQNYVAKVSPQLDKCKGQTFVGDLDNTAANNANAIGQQGIKTCYEAPFKHALYHKNYGGKYSLCQPSFDAEVAARLGALVPPMTSAPTAEASAAAAAAEADAIVKQSVDALQTSQVPVATPATAMLPGDIDGAAVPDQCKDAAKFFKYATQSCRTGRCVDQQLKNTAKIPSFIHCHDALSPVAALRKAPLPTHITHNPWTMPAPLYAH